MICNEILKSQRKPYPKTCSVHGLRGCPDPNYVRRYAAAKGWVQRQWIVDEILQHDVDLNTMLHRVLQEGAKYLEESEAITDDRPEN